MASIPVIVPGNNFVSHSSNPERNMVMSKIYTIFQTLGQIFKDYGISIAAIVGTVTILGLIYSNHQLSKKFTNLEKQNEEQLKAIKASLKSDIQTSIQQAQTALTANNVAQLQQAQADLTTANVTQLQQAQTDLTTANVTQLQQAQTALATTNVAQLQQAQATLTNSNTEQLTAAKEEIIQAGEYAITQSILSFNNKRQEFLTTVETQVRASLQNELSNELTQSVAACFNRLQTYVNLNLESQKQINTQLVENLEFIRNKTAQFAETVINDCEKNLNEIRNDLSHEITIGIEECFNKLQQIVEEQLKSQFGNIRPPAEMPPIKEALSQELYSTGSVEKAISALTAEAQAIADDDEDSDKSSLPSPATSPVTPNQKQPVLLFRGAF